MIYLYHRGRFGLGFLELQTQSPGVRQQKQEPISILPPSPFLINDYLCDILFRIGGREMDMGKNEPDESTTQCVDNLDQTAFYADTHSMLPPPSFNLSFQERLVKPLSRHSSEAVFFFVFLIYLTKT